MTSALTPHATHHKGLGALDSRFVHVSQLPWENTEFEGITVKTLLVDKETGLLWNNLDGYTVALQSPHYV